jgi:hypothetical protein
MHKATTGALKVASLQLAGLGLRQLGAPLASSALGTGGTLIAGTLRTGAALTTAAARQVSFAVSTHGVSSVAVTYLGSAVYTFYLAHAVEITTAGLMGAEIAVALAGQDMGVSPGAELSMVVVEAKAAAGAVKEYKLIKAEVKEMNLASKLARTRVTKVVDITEKTAKAEYDLGKKLTLKLQAAPGMDEEAIKGGKLAAYTFEQGGHTWPILKDGRVLRCSRWCSPASVEEAFGDLIKRHPHLTKEMTKLEKLKGKAAAEAAANLGNRLDQIRNGERMTLDALEKSLEKPKFAKGTPTGNDLRFVLYQKKGGKLGFEEWTRMEMKLNLPTPAVGERDAGVAVKNHFPSRDWEDHPLYLQGRPTEKIGGRNPLGSSEPDWYSKAKNAALEVKNKDFIARLESVDWNAITLQLEQRIHAMPPGTKNWIVFDIRRQPVSVAEASILPKLSSKWDEIFFLTDGGMLKAVGKKAVPLP